MKTINASVRIVKETGKPELYFEWTRMRVVQLFLGYKRIDYDYPCYYRADEHSTATRYYIKYETRNPKTLEEKQAIAQLVAFYERVYECKLNVVPWYRLGRGLSK